MPSFGLRTHKFSLTSVEALLLRCSILTPSLPFPPLYIIFCITKGCGFHSVIKEALFIFQVIKAW